MSIVPPNPSQDETPEQAERARVAWARDMVKGLPPMTRHQILSVSVYRRAFPGLPWSLEHDPAA